jgi:hypothetical protein
MVFALFPQDSQWTPCVSMKASDSGLHLRELTRPARQSPDNKLVAFCEFHGVRFAEMAANAAGVLHDPGQGAK